MPSRFKEPMWGWGGRQVLQQLREAGGRARGAGCGRAEGGRVSLGTGPQSLWNQE